MTQYILVDESESVIAAQTILGPKFKIAQYAQIDVAGIKVVYWPTAPGIGASRRANTMAETAEEVKVLITASKPHGWNAVAALAEGWNYEQWLEWARGKAVLITKIEEVQPDPPSIIDQSSSNGASHQVSEEPASEELSEDALAIQFTNQHAADWRYVANWGIWFKWNGQCWLKETTLDAYDRIRKMCRDEAQISELKREQAKRKCYSSSTVAGVERLVRADRAHAMTVDQWDLDPWKLNTPGGVVDLKSGLILPSAREFFMTKITRGNPKAPARPTRWLQFLSEITAGDLDLQGYLARVAGYSLTGSTEEHALFFFYGTGANGKSVFLSTLSYILGDYSHTAGSETFLESHQSGHPTDIAALRGARAVIASEVANGRRWDEVKIKTLTGGDKISARFMRQDFFEYTPQFKLIIAGNHKPGLRDVDVAMRRRLHLVPFTVTIPPEARDPHLIDTLKIEADGILAWAVAGCLEWQSKRLAPPAAVIGATDEYFESEDALQRWINECCGTAKQDSGTTASLYESWKIWAERSGEFIGSIKRFSETLASRGYERWREPTTDRMGFRGIKVS